MREFTIGQVASLFFDRSAQWLRWMEREGHLDRGGKPIGGRKANGRTLGGGDRSYTLDQVGQIADVLLKQGYIDEFNLHKVHRRIAAMADEVKVGKRG